MGSISLKAISLHKMLNFPKTWTWHENLQIPFDLYLLEIVNIINPYKQILEENGVLDQKIRI